MRFVKFNAGTEEKPRFSVVDREVIVGVTRDDGGSTLRTVGCGDHPLTEVQADAIVEELSCY